MLRSLRIVLWSAVALAVAAPLMIADAAEAKKPVKRMAVVVEQGVQLSQHPNARYYRRQGPRVYGYYSNRRVGGYSYSYLDGVLDFRDSTILRDQPLTRQGSPFDTDFFFNSGLLRHNEAPY